MHEVTSGGAALRGSSGATVSRLNGGQVIKRGGARVSEQGRYLHQLTTGSAAKHLPSVHTVTEDSYTMEILRNPAPLHHMSALSLTREFVTLLENYVWRTDVDLVAFDHVEHDTKIASLLADRPSHHNRMIALKNRIRWHSLEMHPTHGDPTFDNLMYRGDTAIIIDPIPPTSAVPSLMSVDIGKIFTSLYGFERIRYNTRGFNSDDVKKAIAFIESYFDPYEVRAGRYWAAVHFYRAVPYMPTDSIRRKMEEMADYIVLSSGI